MVEIVLEYNNNNYIYNIKRYTLYFWYDKENFKWPLYDIY